jgi:predicted RNA binding protein YcfA (HicA-like mRNA interferase family)
LAPLKPLPFRVVRRKLEAAGFHVHSQRGSHVKFVRVSAGETRICIVPRHDEIPIGTLRSILHQSGLTPQEFEAL